MVDMAKTSTDATPPAVPDEDEPRRFLRNKTGAALTVHPSARPVPDIVNDGELVEVDAWALDSLKASGFEHVGKTTAKPEHEAQVAAALAKALAPAQADDTEQPADEHTDDTADPAGDQEG